MSNCTEMARFGVFDPNTKTAVQGKNHEIFEF